MRDIWTPWHGCAGNGTVGKAGTGLRQNCRPSVPTLAGSRAGRGKKGFFSPETESVGSSRAQWSGF